MKKHILFGAVLAVILSTCGQGPVDNDGTGVSTFPLTVGNRWVYERHYYEIPFGNPSTTDTVIFANIIRRVINVDPEGYSIVDDSVTMTGLFEDQYVERYWYRLEDYKLKEYAYRSFRPGESSEPNFWPLPSTLLDFPLTVGKRWLVTQASYGPVNRYAYDSGMYVFDNRFIACALVRTESPVSEPLDWVDWYSDEGLIYRHIDLGLQDRTDEIGRVIDSAYVHDDLRLIGMQLVE